MHESNVLPTNKALFLLLSPSLSFPSASLLVVEKLQG